MCCCFILPFFLSPCDVVDSSGCTAAAHSSLIWYVVKTMAQNQGTERMKKKEKKLTEEMERKATSIAFLLANDSLTIRRVA